ncbi:hypothetical protein [Ectobacillus antri]|uniref:capsular polysaccharide export protein, LipB/KpsS family n=1 Tax=Ectobacillus antri TaxID=2486280 RepID=UPI000F58FDB9|nr:hypothetical protein [Ectobacillus antri]
MNFLNKSVKLGENFDKTYYKLGVIFPFRYSEDRPDAFERAHWIFSEWSNKKDIKFYMVDSGSPQKYANQLENICNEYDVNYIYLDTSYEMFSAGKARDVGAIWANAEYLFFQDIDLLGYEGFYDELLIEIEARELCYNNEDFIMIPAIYLTEEASKEYINTNPKLRKSKFVQKVYEGNKDLYVNLASGSSALLINRLHYLSIGGHDNDFFGHGFEDFELIHRLSSISNYYKRPREYYTDFRNWGATDYKGFRSLFRLHGDLAAIKGMYLFHIYHPNNKKSAYVSSTANNRKLLTDKMKQYDEGKTVLTPLPDVYAGKTLALGIEGNGFYKSIHQTLPQFGLITYKSENDFITEDDFITYLNYNNISRVLMPNPYGNPKRLSLYQVCKREGIPFIVQDRGALMDSVFFDNNGFNADSSSYHESNWNRPLSESESEIVQEYIRSQYFNEASLERQGQRLGGNKLLQKLNVKYNEKVLFVPFQRPNDTVIRYFSGAVGSVAEFVVFLEQLKKILGPEWRIFAKKHPLEANKPVADIEFVDDDIHVKDLIEACDAVLLINSGVGVESMMWYKPVLYVGQAFYGFDEINKHVRTPQEAAQVLNNLFEVNRDKVHRFIHYLITEFYSFGKARTELVKQPDGSLFNATRGMDFYKIVVPEQPVRRYAVRNQVKVNMDAPLYDRYKKFLEIRDEDKKAGKVEADKSQDATKSSSSMKNEKKQEPNGVWLTRQFVKLITNPVKFMKHYRRWKRKTKIK